ncbi:hypothetical protein SS50377_25238 [Spironucleus salmonicida]|uniref:Uncharacterized protein n=1 Tax=Spironucleus salmonicida TaxID=348837 RepID=V6LDW2_9EUKA|nr:hypothetical protein SS50377_25238 [Spironucleus salmonicida]|eukprot:EST41881.1 Hypothetical protein SS50377_18718 [Spironucleus salmonicida]
MTDSPSADSNSECLSLPPMIHKSLIFVNRFASLPLGDQIAFLDLDFEMVLLNDPRAILLHAEIVPAGFFAALDVDASRFATMFSRVTKGPWVQLCYFAEGYLQAIAVQGGKVAGRKFEKLNGLKEFADQIQIVFDDAICFVEQNSTIFEDVQLPVESMLVSSTIQYAQCLAAELYGTERFGYAVRFIVRQVQLAVLRLVEGGNIKFKIHSEPDIMALLQLVEDDALVAASIAVKGEEEEEEYC